MTSLDSYLRARCPRSQKTELFAPESRLEMFQFEPNRNAPLNNMRNKAGYNWILEYVSNCPSRAIIMGGQALSEFNV
jgi:hypothetical protein